MMTWRRAFADDLTSTCADYQFWVLDNSSSRGDAGGTATPGSTAVPRGRALQCAVEEQAGVGLVLSAAQSASAATFPSAAAASARMGCGVRTRDACPYGSAASGCGFSSGPPTVNPFADRVLLSLLDVSTATLSSIGSLWLMSSSTGGAIKLEYGSSGNDNATDQSATISWTSGSSTAGGGGRAGNGEMPTSTAASWTPVFNTTLPPACFAPASASTGLQIQNISLTLTVRTFAVAIACNGSAGPRGAVAGGSGNHNIDWRLFAAGTAGELGVGIGVTRGKVQLKGFAARSIMGNGHMQALLAPVPNLSGGASTPYLGSSHPLNLTALGILNPTLQPFNADPTGGADATAALQAAVEYARRNYLVLWLPANSVFKVSDTIVAKETNRLDAVDGGDDYWQQGRYAPLRWVGSTKGRKPTLLLAPNSFANASDPKPVVWYWYQSGSASKSSAPPYFGGHSQPNANCNQIFQGIDIQIGEGNPGAIGIRARGAQMMVVQDVTVYLNGGLVGISGGAGSGGSHYGVTVVGGKYGADLTTAQPGPTLTGITLINQTCSALVYSGLQALTAVGLRIDALVPLAQPAIVTGCNAATSMPPDWDGTLFTGRCALPQFVPPEIIQPCIPANSGSLTVVDSVLTFGSWASEPAARAVGIAAAASIYLVNVHMANAASLVNFHGGDSLLPPSHAGREVGFPRWSTIEEYAHGVHFAPRPNETQRAAVPAPEFTSRVHMFDPVTMKHLPANTSNTIVTTLKVGIIAETRGPPAWLTAKHLYNGVDARQMPSFETPNAVLAYDYGASPFGVVDNSGAFKAALAAAAAVAAEGGAGVVVLGRGVFRVGETVTIPPGVSLVGAGLHLTSLVPISVGFEGTPVVRTTGGATVLAGLSVSTWAHYSAVTAVEWGAGLDSVWYQVHVNRMIECGISGGTPLSESPLVSITRAEVQQRHAYRRQHTRQESPAVVIPTCRLHKKIGLPLVLVTGSGSFYNFYNEDAMQSMVAGDYQLPSYRHILVSNTTGVRFYHFNPEHSVSDANSEFRNSRNISVFGTKSEGHSSTLWVRDCADIFHTGHGGNAFPYSCSDAVCPTWHPSPCACAWTTGAPSLFRIENCTGNCRFGNLWSQTSQGQEHGQQYAAFYGKGTASPIPVTTGAMECPVVVATSSTLKCDLDPTDAMTLLCVHATV